MHPCDAFVRIRQFIEGISPFGEQNAIPLHTHTANLIQFNRINRSKYSLQTRVKNAVTEVFPLNGFPKLGKENSLRNTEGHGEGRGEMCNGSTLPVGSFQDV